MEKNVSQEFIDHVCALYNDVYDDRVENTCPPTAGSSPCIPGEDWAPGQRAEHKSLSAFQQELQENGIFLSTVGRRILSGKDVFFSAGSCEQRGLIGTTDFPRQKQRGVVGPSIARSPGPWQWKGLSVNTDFPSDKRRGDDPARIQAF